MSSNLPISQNQTNGSLSSTISSANKYFVSFRLLPFQRRLMNDRNHALALICLTRSSFQQPKVAKLSITCQSNRFGISSLTFKIVQAQNNWYFFIFHIIFTKCHRNTPITIFGFQNNNNLDIQSTSSSLDGKATGPMMMMAYCYGFLLVPSLTRSPRKVFSQKNMIKLDWVKLRRF